MLDKIVVPVGLGALSVAFLVLFFSRLRRALGYDSGTDVVESSESQRTVEEILIGDAYCVAETAWQAYRKRTDDTTEGIQLRGTAEKDEIRELWAAFFALYEPWITSNPPPDGMSWGCSNAGPVLYSNSSEIPPDGGLS